MSELIEDLTVTWVPIDSIKPDPRNPRKSTKEGIEKLRKSLERWGWTRPILAQKDTRIIVFGHQIHKAAQLRGDKKVPVIFKEFTDSERKAYNVADNKLSELSSWDDERLTLILKELKPEMDLGLLGFEKKELDKLMEDLKQQSIPLPDKVYEIIISCESEEEQQKAFQDLTEAGYKCRPLIF